MDHKRNFRDNIENLMIQLPRGSVTTYGDLAVMAGSPRAARIVGGIAHYGAEELPWHRLVNSQGGLAIGFPGGQAVQRQLLENEGIACTSDFRIVNFEERRWRP